MRFLDYLKEAAPPSWEIIGYNYTGRLPQVIDDPSDILPDDLPQGDLLLYLGQHRKLAELIPEIAEICGVRGVIAGVENSSVFPTGLQNQTRRQLENKDIDVVFPDPFCALAEQDSDNEFVRLFARHFGRPELRVAVEGGKVKEVVCLKSAPCGNTRYVADNLCGIGTSECMAKARRLHRQHPCTASTRADHTRDTSMDRAARLVENAVSGAMAEVD